jgi:hypothetical protein
MCASNWVIHSTPRPCERPNLLRLIPLPSRLLCSPRPQRLRTAYPLLPPPGNWAICKVMTLPCNRMAPCAVLLITLSTPRNDARSVMEPCGWCMPLALVIVVPVYYGRSANGTGAPLRNHGESVRYYIPSSPSPCSMRRRRHRGLSSPSCGEIGNAVSIGGSWSSSFVANRSISDTLKRLHRLSLPHRTLSPVHSGHIGACRGPNVWLAMPLRRQRLPPRSPFLGSRTPLPLLWACRPSNSTQELC